MHEIPLTRALGRLFSNNSALRSDGKTTSTSKAKSKSAKKKNAAAVKAAQEVVAEQKRAQQEAEAEDQSKAAKKKKKKGGKKADEADDDSVKSPTSQGPFSPGVEPESPTTSVASPTSPKGKKGKGSTPTKSTGADPLSSTTTLPLPTETKAESARKYLQTLPETKAKVKSRPEGATSIFDGFKKSFVSEEKDEEDDVQEKASSGLSRLSRLKKHAREGARRLFGVGGAQERKGHMRWDKFVDVGYSLLTLLDSSDALNR